MNPDARFSSDSPPVAKPAAPAFDALQVTIPTAFPLECAAQPNPHSFAAPPFAPSPFPQTHLTPAQALIDLIAVTVALFMGQFLLSNLAQLLKETLESQGEFILNTVLGVMTLTSVGLALYARKLPYASIGLNRPSAGVLLASTAAAIPACYVVTAAMGFMFLSLNYLIGGSGLEDVAQQRQKFFAMVPDPSISTFVMFAAFTGLHEEILFRGFALPRFIAVFKSRWAGIVFCSALFGVAHMYQGTMSIFQTGGLGLLFCLMAVITRSIWPSVIAHALFNAINLALIPVLRDMLPDMLEQVTSQPVHS